MCCVKKNCSILVIRLRSDWLEQLLSWLLSWHCFGCFVVVVDIPKNVHNWSVAWSFGFLVANKHLNKPLNLVDWLNHEMAQINKFKRNKKRFKQTACIQATLRRLVSDGWAWWAQLEELLWIYFLLQCLGILQCIPVYVDPFRCQVVCVIYMKLSKSHESNIKEV